VLLSRHYTHVLDLRDRSGDFVPAVEVARLIEAFEGWSTDLLACRR